MVSSVFYLDLAAKKAVGAMDGCFERCDVRSLGCVFLLCTMPVCTYVRKKGFRTGSFHRSRIQNGLKEQRE